MLGLASRLSSSFRLGFWWGVFLIAPFYIWQVAYQYRAIFAGLPKMQVILYVTSTVAVLLSAIATGLVTWAAYDVFLKAGKHRMTATTIISRVLIIFLCLLVLMPVFGKNLAAQPDLVDKKIRFRNAIEREPAGEPPYNVIILGVDGGNWEVIEALIEDGKLPAFEKLMSEGRWGTLESQMPMMSPMLWTTMFTGKSQEEHGISEWNVSFSRNRLVKAIWNILSEYKLRTTMINVPATYPPEKINGKMISGFPYSSLTLNSLGWLCGSKPIKSNYTPGERIKLNLQSDGSYDGNLVVTDILMENYYADLSGMVLKSFLLETILKTRKADIYGSEIVVAKFKYFENEGRLELYSPKSDELISVISMENPNSKFLLVQVAPGIVVKTKIMLLEMKQDNIMLYVSPFFTISDKPKYNYTYPHTLAKEIGNIVDQYIVEMTWLSAKDFILLPAIKEMLLYTADTQAKVGNVLFNERDWDMFIQVFSITDRLQHPTWAFKYGEIPDGKFVGLDNIDEIQFAGEQAIEEAYVRCDKWIGNYMENIDPEKDIVFITSDHGFMQGDHAQSLLGVHHLDGIYILWGGLIKPVSRSDYIQNRSERKSIIDVTKNVLYILGLPLAKDMGGKLWLDLLDPEYIKNNIPELISTYNLEEAEKEITHTVDESTLEQLRGLGYI